MAGHLIKRFFGSFRAKLLSEEDAAWVQSQLLAGEKEVWARMTTADQGHACAVARQAVELLGEKATRPVVAAALLHDVGKIQADAGTLLRTIATLVGTTASRSQIDSWAQDSGWLGRAGRYLRHNEIGAVMLQSAGSDPLTIAWAREHELPQSQWTLPDDISDALWRSDHV